MNKFMMRDKRTKVIYLSFIIVLASVTISNGCTVDGIDDGDEVHAHILDVFRGKIFDNSTTGIQSISMSDDENLNAGPYFNIRLEDSRLVVETNELFERFEEYETAYDEATLFTNVYTTLTYSCTAGTVRIVFLIISIVDTNNNHPQFLQPTGHTYIVPTPLPPAFTVTGCFDGITVRDIDITTTSIDFTIEENPYFEVVYNPDISNNPKEFVGQVRTKSFIRNLPERMDLVLTATDNDKTGDPQLNTTTTITIIRDSEFEFPEDPVFFQPFYNATYTNDHKLILDEPISLRSGYDDKLVNFYLKDYSDNFELKRNYNEVTFETKIPLDAVTLRKKQIILVLMAEKENTSGDTTTIIVQLPEDIVLQFENNLYEGTIEDNKLRALQLTLTQGYEGEDISLQILGDLKNYFAPTIDGNVITLSLNENSDNIIADNNVISIEVEASTEFSKASTIVTLEIIKDDHVTPVFDEPIYTGSYLTETGLELQPIVLVQGYEHIELTLAGEHKKFFKIDNDEDVVTITTIENIPPSIFKEQRIVLTAHATKPRTVGAHATIIITLPEDIVLQFEKSFYEGAIEDSSLRAPQLILTAGHEGENIDVQVLGEFENYFTPTIDGNVITLSLNENSDDIIADNNFITIGVEASTEFYKASTIVTLEIIKDDRATPVFDKPIYTGSYFTETGLQLQPIVLAQGYDDIELTLDGEHKKIFKIDNDEDVVTITTIENIPPSIFKEQRIVLTAHATKPRTVGAHATIIITMPEDIVLQFEKSFYEGVIEESSLRAPQLILTAGHEGEDIGVQVLGGFKDNFTPTIDGNVITLSLNENSDNIIADNNVISIEVEASTEFSKTSTIVTLEIIKDDHVTPVFDKPIYTGSYLTETGLELQPIVLVQGYKDIELTLAGEHKKFFKIDNDEDLVTITTIENIPPSIFKEKRIVLTAHATKPRTVGAHAAIIITLPGDSEPVDDVSFDELVYTGHIEYDSVKHDKITVFNNNGNNVEIRGEYSTFFEAKEQEDGVVTLSAPDTLTLPENVAHVVLELHAADARAVLVLAVKQSDSLPEDGVSFDELVYEGDIELNSVRHEKIIIHNYNENNIIIRSDYSTFFDASVKDGLVTVVAQDSLTLPENVTHVVLELHAADARAVLVLAVKQIDSEPVDDVSFDELVYTGDIEYDSVKHDKITIFNYKGNNVRISGEHSNLFTATVDHEDGAVTVTGPDPLTLPEHVTHVVLELHAADARAVLVLVVKQSDSLPEDGVSFDELVYEGDIELNSVRHEKIIIHNYSENNVIIRSDYSIFFDASVKEGVVTVVAQDSLRLPENVTHVVLELHAADARAVLVLAVKQLDLEPVDDVSFDELVYTGNIEYDSVKHDKITVFNYNGNNVRILGEHSSLFTATVDHEDGAVTVTGPDQLTLPEHVTHVVLELHAADARAVLVLVVKQSDSLPEDGVSFDELVYEGYIELDSVRHEKIIIHNYNENNVIIRSDYSIFFDASVQDGVVTVVAQDSLRLPEDVTHVVLELHAADARAVLVLAVKQLDSEPVDDVSFDELVYTGNIEYYSVKHDKITVFNYNGNNVRIRGEHSSLFTATVDHEDGAVTVTGPDPLTLPEHVTHVVLELHAADARAVLVLVVKQSDSLPEDGVSFNELVYEGYIELDSVRHEKIIIHNYNENNVILRSDYLIFFDASVQDGVVTVIAQDSLTLPENVTHVVLELHAADARAVLVLAVKQLDSKPVDDVSFDELVYTGNIEYDSVKHDKITVFNYNGNNVRIRGEHSSLFTATVDHEDGAVTVTGPDPHTLPEHVTQVVLELHAADARAVLVIVVKQSDLLPEDGVSFDELVYEGYIELDSVRHEKIIIHNYNENNVIIRSDYSIFFDASIQDGVLTVVAQDSLRLPENVTHVVLELHAADARAVLVLAVKQLDSEPVDDVSFDELVYTGNIEYDSVKHDKITVFNYNGNNVRIRGEHSSFFTATVDHEDGAVTVTGPDPHTLPEHVTQVVLELHAADARAVLVLVVKQSDSLPEDGVSFDELVYEGYIKLDSVRHEKIIIHNYNENNVIIRSDYSIFFDASVQDGVVTVVAQDSLRLPENVTHVVLELHAADARAVLVLAVKQLDSEPVDDVSFDELVYTGDIEYDSVKHDKITVFNYNGNNVRIRGEHSSLFTATVDHEDGAVTVTGPDPLTLPEHVTHVVLELHAADARAVLVLVVKQSDSLPEDGVSFDELVYEGYIELDSVRHEKIIIHNYNENNVIIRSDYSIFFDASVKDGVVTVVAQDSLTLPENVTHVVLELHAADARAVLVLAVKQLDSEPVDDVSFDELVYTGDIEYDSVKHDKITVFNYKGNNVRIRGEHSSLFTATVDHEDGAVTVTGPNPLTLPEHVTHVVLELHAADARAVLILVVKQSDSLPEDGVSFDELVYEGDIELNSVRHEKIIIHNYNENNVIIRSDYSIFFDASVKDGVVTVVAQGSLTLPENVTHVVLELHAADARAVLVLAVKQLDSGVGDDVSFEKLIYKGLIQFKSIQHQSITIFNYDGVHVELHGEYASLFVARSVDGVVTVIATDQLALPEDVTRVVLELHVANAKAVLLLDVNQSDIPVLPKVTFNSASYVVNVDVVRTGQVGSVTAAADNGEELKYSISTEDAHLLARVSINNEGVLYLSAPAHSGVYTFQVIATTVITQARGTATVLLTVQAIIITDDNNIVVPPLIVLNRNEEQPPNNLLILDQSQLNGCQFTLTNQWPQNQEWLYTDEKGLHARSIDREDPSIAFMALSQIQVELILYCEGDQISRTKRSSRTDWLGPYDYGSNQWIIGETIPHDNNSRRSIVNLIVNDINDNRPIFIGKEQEPLAIGYPDTDIEAIILPRSLIELQATDADIGDNAAILYWSSEDELAVSPTTGFVHVKNGAEIENDQRLIVSATDLNGQGLTGTIELVVKLLHINNIAVVTINNAFLDDESFVIAELSKALGYDIKVLKSVVISGEDDEENVSRYYRSTNTTGASLQLHVYGLIQREPVYVDRLIEDIINNAVEVNVISTVSLEDHLVPERDTAFFVATIVLSSLLFIILLCIGTWYFLKWRKNRKYNQFSDENSLASTAASLDKIYSTETPKPRLNIEELKRSERRLQDMLNTPIDAIEVTVETVNAIKEPVNAIKEPSTEVLADIHSPESTTSIVIQSIDKLKDWEESDDDEFGEKPTHRKKSVVTFNENVEKIIHVENDTGSITSTSDFESFQF